MLLKHKNTNGFTLIEILASIVLLTVIISMFLAIFPQMTNMNNKTEDNLQAANIGKEYLVKLKNYKNNEFKSRIETILSQQNSNVFTEDYKSFKVRITISPNADVQGDARTLYRLQIEVEDSTNALTTTYGYLKK